MKRTKISSLVLALALSLTLALPAFAAETEPTINHPITASVTAQEAADYLYTLGLFNGTGTNADGTPIYELNKAPTRAEGVTMLVRLIGQEAAAKASSQSAPFTDVPDWARPYVTYAYNNGLTMGRDETTFDPDTAISPSEYLTLVLRALGYDSSTDFRWDSAWSLTNKLGVTTAGTYENAANSFNRGDVAMISARALGANLKGAETLLLADLLDKGAVDRVYHLGTVLTSAVDQLYVGFAPTYASPETYTSFRVSKVTANGLPCAIKQYDSPKEIADFFAQEDQKANANLVTGETFAMVGLQYDEAAAKAAATEFYTEDFGEDETFDFPIINFEFQGVGTLADGTTVTETFTISLYMDAYDGPLNWF